MFLIPSKCNYVYFSSEKHAGCENIVDKNDESTDNMNTQFIENIDDKQNISIPTDESDDEEGYTLNYTLILCTHFN